MESLRYSVVSGLTRLYRLVASRPLERVYDAVTIGAIVFYHRVLAASFVRVQFGFDERYFLNEGWSVLKGLVPYRDIQEFKPPMIFVVNALGLKLFGLEGMAYRKIFVLLSIAGFLSLALALLSRGTNRLLVVAVSALMITHYFHPPFFDSSIVNTESLSLYFFMIGCGILLFKTRLVRVQQFAGGACLALSPLSKEPMAFATLAAWLAFLLLCRTESRQKGAVKRFALYTISGVAAVALTWLVYMLATRSLGWYIVQLKLTMKYTKNYAIALGWFPKNPPGGEFAEIWRRLRATYLNADRLGVFVPLFLALLTLWSRKTIVGVFALLAMVGSVYAVTIGRGFAAHYYIMAMAGTFLSVAMGALALDSYTGPGTPLRRWVGLSWAAIAAVVLWPRFSDELDKYDTLTTPAPPLDQTELASVLQYSKPGDKIWTLGDPLLYVYSNRVLGFREAIVTDELIEYYPGDTDEHRLAGLRDELMTNLPKVVIFGGDPVGYRRKQRFIDALVTPFLRDAGYKKIDEKVYVHP
jgi:hypothetical protein